LNFFFEGLDGFLEIVNGDLVVFNNTTNDEFVYSVSNWFLLVVLFPNETVKVDTNNFNEEGVEVSFSFVWLNFEEKERFSNDSSFLWGSILLLCFFKSLFSFLI
jgi:hypothetical protein